MPDHKVSYCRSCRAKIIWMKTVNGKNIPVDAPQDNDVFIDALDRAAGRALEGDIFDSKKHISHFATCPNSNQHRKG